MFKTERDKSDAQEIMDYSLPKAKDILQKWSTDLQLPSDVQVSSSIWDDCAIAPWIEQNISTDGGRTFAWTILQHPTANITTLQERQNIIRSLKTTNTHFTDVERDFLWLFTLPDITESPSLQLLFPTFFALRFINTIPTILMMFHVYKGCIAPFLNFATPLCTILGPYFFLRRNFGKTFTLRAYLRLFVSLAKRMCAPSGMIQKDISKLGSIGLYVILFVVGTVQSFEIAKNVRHLRSQMMERINRIREFVATNLEMVSKIPTNVWQSFGLRDIGVPLTYIPSDLTFLFQCITNHGFRNQITIFVKQMYILDVCHSIRTYFINAIRNTVCMVRYTNQPSRFWAMGHIRLATSQVRNPCDISKNLIITGPNAGGKTTYVKALCANMILSQTYGFAIAQKAHVQPIHAFGSFMRTTDVLGETSLFEAEVQRCVELVRHAEKMSATGLRALYFLDEPMNSTPPTEGASTTLGTVEYLGNLPGIRVIVTTHFHQITQLGHAEQNNFLNLSMEAISNPDGTFRFPYRICSGPSFQCIALELLQTKDVPRELITRAIKWKNKICDRQVK